MLFVHLHSLNGILRRFYAEVKTNRKKHLSFARAYFDSVESQKPPRWSSISLSRSQTALAHLDEVVSLVKIVLTVFSKLVVSSIV